MRSLRARTVLLTALLTGALAACAQAPVDGGPGGSGDRLDAQAREALERWDAAVAGSGATDRPAFVPTGSGTELVGAWEPELADNGKAALLAGLVEAAGGPAEPGPARGRVRWADGTTLDVALLSPAEGLHAIRQAAGDAPTTGLTPIEVGAARLVEVTTPTDRGDATVPAWEYEVVGSAARITRIAVASGATVGVTPPPWDPNDPPAGLRPDSVTVAPDGRTVTLRFVGGREGTGPCTSRYTARAVESRTAVVLIIEEHADEPGSPCPSIGYPRVATATLAEPLGNRTLLDVVQGQPVPVVF